MKETTAKEINVDKIMKNIREEVARRKTELQKTKQDTAEKPIANEDEINIKNIPEYTERLLIDDFLQYHDEEFINNAYRGILKREPDTEGFENNLALLRKGQLNKVEILGNLRYSREGKENNVKIKGLFLGYLINISYRIPIIGYILKLLISIASFPKILRNHQEYEAFTNARYTENRKEVDKILECLSTKANVQSLSTKADVQIVDELENGLRNNKLNILDQERRLTLLLKEVRKSLPEPISTEQIKNMLKEEEHLLDAMYVTFEDEFRGTRDEIKERQKVYLPYIESVKAGTDDAPVIDVGCGRGEWLELLKENGYIAKGIDINKVMVEQCKDLSIEVNESDVIDYLSREKQNSIGAITGFHIVEHCPMKTLILLFDEVLRVLKPGGVVIFETPNPENIIVGACNFYIDPTHRNPIPPITLKFLIEARGFVNTEILRLHPYHYFENKAEESDFNKKLLDLFNKEQDYSVIAYKP